MILGFTGTSNGVTEEQRAVMRTRITAATELHHGDCIGADATAHVYGLEGGLWLVGYPPLDPKKRAWCDFDVLRPEKPYLDRNRDIVDNVRTLLAVPKELSEPNHRRAGGTWYTIRYARRVGRALTIVWPDGSLSHE